MFCVSVFIKANDSRINTHYGRLYAASLSDEHFEAFFSHCTHLLMMWYLLCDVLERRSRGEDGKHTDRRDDCSNWSVDASTWMFLQWCRHEAQWRWKKCWSKSRDGRISECAESPVMARNWGRKMMKPLEYVARGEWRIQARSDQKNVKMRPDRTKKMLMLGRMMLVVLLPGCRIMTIVDCIIHLLSSVHLYHGVEIG